MGCDPTVHSAFGLRFRCHFPLPELPIARGDGAVDFDVSLAAAAEVRAAFGDSSDQPRIRATVLGDGQRYVTERGAGGDYRIEYGDRALLHLSSDGRELRCAAADPEEPSWRRFLLDSGLATVALVRGFEALHAGAVEHPRGVVAIAASETGGKSTLLAELMCRGCRFFCDDILVLSGGTMAEPGPPLMNLPPVLPGGVPAGCVGRVLARLGDECWLAVGGAATERRPLVALVLLERGDHDTVAIERLPKSAAPLLRYSLMSGTAPERLQRRFAVLGDVATAVPVWRLWGPKLAPPSAYADALEVALHDR